MSSSVPPIQDQPDPAELNEEDGSWDTNPYNYEENRQEEIAFDNREENSETPHFFRRPTDMLRTLADYSGKPVPDLPEGATDEYWEEDEEEDESRFVNYSLLSHIAMQLRDKVPRDTHVKGSIPYPRAFTGKDIVVCIYSLQSNHRPE